jgi:Ni/Co efflux regulator RcnB
MKSRLKLILLSLILAVALVAPAPVMSNQYGSDQARYSSSYSNADGAYQPVHSRKWRHHHRHDHNGRYHAPSHRGSYYNPYYRPHYRGYYYDRNYYHPYRPGVKFRFGF